MPTNIKIKTHVVKELPTERPLEKGAVYKVEQPNGDLLTYTIDSSGNPVLERGITNDQNDRLERLSSEQISKVESITTGDITKLKEDYTKVEIDQQFNAVRNLANSSRINLNGSTVLPVPPRRPDDSIIEDAWVRLAQNVTYTQAGGSPLTGIDGHETIAEWNNEDGEWVLVDMGELPQVEGTNILNPEGEGVPKEKATATYVKPLFDLTKGGVNILNPETVLSGSYRGSNGSFAENSNAIRTPMQPLAPSQTKLSGSGVGSISTDPATFQSRFVFYDAGKNIIGHTVDLVNVDIPEGAVYWAMTIADQFGIGIDPVNNPYKNTMMVNYGSAPLPYVPYGVVVDAAKVEGVPPDTEIRLVETESSITNLNTRVVGVEEYLDFEDSYTFPVGVSVNTPSLTLANTGDYIEFQARTDAANGGNTLRIFGTPTSTTGNSINALGFYNGVLRLRGNLNNDAWVEFTDMPTFDEFHVYRIQVNGSNWDLYIDDVLHQTKPKTSNFVFSNIGSAYNAASGDRAFYLKEKVSVRVSGVTTNMNNFNEINNQVIKNRTGRLDDTVYRDVYVSFDPTGYSGREQFIVFLRKKDNIFVGINIIRQGNAGTDTNLFRINRAFEYSFNGVVMSQGVEVLTEGESEFTVLVSGVNGGAHTGGAHGHEVYSIFKFYVDGEEINMANGGFDLRPANTAFYVQRSNILNDSDSPILEHYKRTDFFPSGYRTRNRIVGLVSPSLPMRFVYTGIVCIGNVNYAMDDYFNTSPVITQNGDVLNNTGDNTLNFYSSQRGIEITSRSITTEIEVDPRMYVQDRLAFNDCKYYRTNNGRTGDVSPVIPLNQGDKWEVECEVKFK